MPLRPSSILTTACACLLAIVSTPAAHAQAVPTQLVETKSGWELQRDGQPYFIRGVGGDSRKDELVERGGNSLRTWGVGPETGAWLDAAHEKGLTVTLGLWMEHERHGFSYADEAAVAAQLERHRQAVLAHKDHPAVLMWSVGNEMEHGVSDPAAVWRAVEDVAAMIQELDPNHPVMTVIAELGADAKSVRMIHELCPSVDVIGINTYGGIVNVGERYRAANPTKPYVITEHGVLGHWEVGKTHWGLPIEQTSTEKAKFYREGYQNAVVDQPGWSLGAYTFLWGEKQETTDTWFGMWLRDGARTEAVDVIQTMWTGEPPANRCPTIAAVQLMGPNVVPPGQTVRVRISASDPDNDPLTVRWVVRHASDGDGWGGDFEERNAEVEGAVIKSDLRSATVRLPDEEGDYRIFYYLYDNHGGAATANVPLLVSTDDNAGASR
ncbi:MAG: glycoside hydrolase family 2 TIM barrel-domain containing protein [Planctomycetota bacterium]